MKGEVLAGEKNPPGFGLGKHWAPLTGLPAAGVGGCWVGRGGPCAAPAPAAAAKLSPRGDCAGSFLMFILQLVLLLLLKGCSSSCPHAVLGRPVVLPPHHPALPPVPLSGAWFPSLWQCDGGEESSGTAWPWSPPCAALTRKPAPAMSSTLRLQSHRQLPAWPRLSQHGSWLGAGGCTPGLARVWRVSPAGRPAALPGTGDGARGSCGRQLPAARARV